MADHDEPDPVLWLRTPEGVDREPSIAEVFQWMRERGELRLTMEPHGEMITVNVKFWADGERLCEGEPHDG
ncbi:hypothetical protein H8E07_19950 [bacterium]|nr:hypothetical protein [bacterium]